MFALFVTIKIKPGHREAFIEATNGDAEGSNNNEPGCLRFEAFADNSDPNTVYLFEVYENREAWEVAPPRRAPLPEVAGNGGRLVRRRPAAHRNHAPLLCGPVGGAEPPGASPTAALRRPGPGENRPRR